MYAQKIKADEELIKGAIKEFHPKAAMQTDKMADLEGAIKDAVN